MTDGYDTDEVVQLETNLDDLSPELLGAVLDKLLQAGALDVWFTPIQMKKNRPGILLSLLCDKPLVSPLANLIFRETTAFGLRTQNLLRLKLQRHFEQVQTPYGLVTLKIGTHNGQVVQVAPEFESCQTISQASGQPLKTIYSEALRSFDHLKNNHLP